MIKQYTVKQENSIYDLTAVVNEAIKFGWEPLGGVSVTNSGLRTSYTQAMVMVLRG